MNALKWAAHALTWGGSIACFFFWFPIVGVFGFGASRQWDVAYVVLAGGVLPIVLLLGGFRAMVVGATLLGRCSLPSPRGDSQFLLKDKTIN